MAAIKMPASYTTVENVYEASIAIQSATTVTSAHVCNMIGKAQAEMNSCLVRHYALPFTQEVPALTALCTEGATYFALRRLFAQAAKNKSTWVDDHRKQWEEGLEALKDGAMDLTDADGGEIARSGVLPWSNVDTYEPTMTERGPLHDVVDPDKIDDLNNERN